MVELLRKHFVCVAIANAGQVNTTKEERHWLYPLGGNASTQGMSAFTAGGKLLATGGNYKPGPVRQMLKTALNKFQAEESPKIEKLGEPNARQQPPEGGLVLYVTWKVLDVEKPKEPATSGNARTEDLFRNALGVDRLWVRKDEAEALAKGQLPDSLRKRLIPHYKFVVPGKMKTDGLMLKDGRLTGTLLADTGERAYARGLVETKDGKVTRFDLIIKGLGEQCSSHGFGAGLTVIPKGVQAPVALGFMLADPADDLSRTLPYHARDANYLK